MTDTSDPGTDTTGERGDGRAEAEHSDGTDETGQETAVATPTAGPDEGYCTRCGAVVSKDVEVCPECGVPPKKEPDYDVTSEVYCHSCGETVAAEAEICTECGVRQPWSQRGGGGAAGGGAGAGAAGGAGQQAQANAGGNKSPAVAAVLSFLIVGLGQLYNGQIARGIAFFVGAIVGGFIIGLVTFGFGTPLVILFPIAAAIDAYKQAEKINRGEVVP